jgi:AraC family transcriptional regulator of adaptative response / DNA-3-methyladenine glycosylase II
MPRCTPGCWRSDASYNGRFFTGRADDGHLLPAGVQGAQAEAGNVRFFPTCEAARAAGLRAVQEVPPG